MKWVLVILIIPGVLISCRKGGCGPGMGPNVQGTYTGTFKRWVGKEGSESQVKITFSGKEFNGSSDSSNYPAICNGTFTVTDMPDSIRFVNQCVFPANFDWTLILNGSYKLVQTGDSLYIRRTIGDFIYEEDVYSLRKQ
jgi:hypothetical protein